jgi:hypothetical protein
MALSIPELQDNKEFLEAISLQYKSYNLFEEMMEMELMQKRVEFIQTMKESMIDMDVEGNEIKFFSTQFLVQKYLKFSSEDIKLNDKLKQEEIEELNLAGAGDSEMGDGAEGQQESGGFGESIDYNKLADLIVEKMSAKSNMVTETDEDNKPASDTPKDKPKKKASKKNKVKTDDEE